MPCEVEKFRSGVLSSGDDMLAVEEPLEIRLRDGNGRSLPVAVTMRTPGNDELLSLGFLLSEGILGSQDEVREVVHVQTFKSEGRGNVIEVTLRSGVTPDVDRLQRHFYTSSSCGVCGKASLEAVAAQLPPSLPASPWSVGPDLLCKLPQELNKSQSVFGKTGGLHAAGLFSTEGELLFSFEDVGRHNAVDKLLGRAMREQMLPLDGYILLLSGRASFELIQKALMGGLSMVAAIGAPSSLAVSLARDHDVTLVGFLADSRFNVYSGQHRIHRTSS